jgi:branched-subunit amino acid transport protein AzlD
VAEEREELAAPSRRRDAAWTVAAGLAGLGVVVNAAAPSTAVSPVIATAMYVGWVGSRAVLVTVAATVVGLVLLRWWPWLLLVGSLLTLPSAIPTLPLWPEGAATAYAALAGAPLALLAVLAAAQELLDGGARGLGVALAGATAGAGLVGAALLGASWLGIPPNLGPWQTLLALLGVAGGALAVARRPAAGGGRSPRLRPGARPTVLGALAALLAFVPVVLTEERVAAVLQVSEGSLARRPYAMAAIVGLVTLGCAALLAAAAGPWPAAAAFTSALAQVGMAAPMILVLYAVVFHPAYGLGAAAIGLAAGGVTAATRWRVPLAAAAGVAASLALLLAVSATGGAPEKVAQQARWVPAGLLLALLVATVTATVAAAAPAAAGRGGLAAMLGPVVGALVVGGKQSLIVTQLRGEPLSSYLVGAPHLRMSAGLLVAAALAVIGLGVAESLRGRLQGPPAATAETGPVGQGS